MIKLDNISLNFHNRVVLNELSFSFENNGLYAIVGSNGSGKTSLLKIIAKIINPSNGRVINDLKTIYIDNECTVFDKLSILDNLRIINDDTNKITSILSLVGLDNLNNTNVSTLSSGEKIRLSIARAIVSNNDVILLDEPFSHLDDENKKILEEILKKISKERIIIFSTNDNQLLTENIIDLSQKNIQKVLNEKKDDVKQSNKLIHKAIFFPWVIYSLITTILLSVVFLSIALFSINEKDIIKNYLEDDFILLSHAYKPLKNDRYLRDLPIDIPNDISVSLAPKCSVFYFVGSKRFMPTNDNFFYYCLYDAKDIYVHNKTSHYKLNNSNIILTDYLYDAFKFFGFIENDFTLKISDDDNCFFSIDKIIETDYKQKIEEKSITFNDFNIYDENYKNVISSKDADYFFAEYSHIYMSDNAYRKMMSYLLLDLLSPSLSLDIKENIPFGVGYLEISSITNSLASYISSYVPEHNYYLSLPNSNALIVFKNVIDNDEMHISADNYNLLVETIVNSTFILPITNNKDIIINLVCENEKQFLPVVVNKELDILEKNISYYVDNISYFMTISLTILISSFVILLGINVLLTIKKTKPLKLLRYLKLDNNYYKHDYIFTLISLIASLLISIIISIIIYNSIVINIFEYKITINHSLSFFIVSIIYVLIIILLKTYERIFFRFRAKT